MPGTWLEVVTTWIWKYHPSPPSGPDVWILSHQLGGAILGGHGNSWRVGRLRVTGCRPLKKTLGSWLLPGTHEVRQKTSVTRSCCTIFCLSTLLELEMRNQVTRNGILWNLELRKRLFVFTLSMSGIWAQWRKSWYRRDWVSHDWTNERMRITRCVWISSKPVQR